jgi:hypothetical protein
MLQYTGRVRLGSLSNALVMNDADQTPLQDFLGVNLLKFYRNSVRN